MTDDIAKRIDALIRTYMAHTLTPGVAVALHFRGQDHFFCHGFADVAQNTAVTRDTIFEIGSMTKVFTATLLASQVVRKVIPPLTKTGNLPYLRLPAAVGASGDTIKDVTYIQLATHTSGLQDSPDGPGGHPSAQLFAGEDPSDALTQWWINSTATPGVCWEYSNIGFVTLGFAVVGPTTGAGYQSYESLLQERIAGLLGMGSTSVHARGVNVARGYRFNDGDPVASTHRASDLKSSAVDILTFLRANLGLWPDGAGRPADLKDLESAITMTQQTYVDTPTSCSSGHLEKFSMGLAWQISAPGTTAARFNKDGATGRGGFTTFMAFVPAQGIAITVLTNLDGASKLSAPATPTALAQTILQTLGPG